MPETCIGFGEFGARVMVEDKEIQHYAIHVDPVKKEVSCWIASEAGKTFSVVWSGLDVDFPTSGYLYLDGQYSQGVLRRRVGEHFDRLPKKFQSRRVSDSLATPYLFSPLAVTDDDAFLEGSSSSSIGEIKLDIHRTSTPVLSADQKAIYKPQPELQKVHERSKKAINHRVNYGSAVAVSPRLTFDAKAVERLVTFIFKYRPLEMLQANEIAPRNPQSLEPQERTPPASPMPESSSGKRKHSGVKEADSKGECEDDQESKREKALLAEVERIRKARHLKNDGRSKKKVKKESKSLLIPGEVIDLT